MALGWDHFENHFLQALTPQDTVVFVISRQDMDAGIYCFLCGEHLWGVGG